MERATRKTSSDPRIPPSRGRTSGPWWVVFALTFAAGVTALTVLATVATGEADESRAPAPPSLPALSAEPEVGRPAAPEAVADILRRPFYGTWRHHGRNEGLPSEKVLCVRVDGERVWAGTDAGLACYESGAWRTWGTADGLPHRVVLALDVSPRTGDLWVGTMGGLARVSGGRIDAFTQLSCGLSNDFVNGVECDPEEDLVWVATAMGANRYDLLRDEWTLFTEENTPMREPWTYAISVDRGLVYVGAWGAGILELEKSSGRWREFRDPDKEMEIDLLPDDGPVHDVTAGVDFESGLLWQASYFGLARYDGRTWRTYFAEDSGLAGNFVQFVRGRDGVGWCGTDRGLSSTDGERWVTYRRREDGRGEVVFSRGSERLHTLVTETSIASDFVLGADFQGDTIWVATEGGISRGELTPPPEIELVAASSEGASPSAVGDDPASGGQAPDASAPSRFIYAKTPEDLLPYRSVDVHHEFYRERPEFRGAGREEPAPDVETVRIGFVGPLADEDGPILPPGIRSGVRSSRKAELFGRPMLEAARIALEEANAEGGYQGKEFRLVLRTDLVQWGQTSNELTEFAYRDGVWAVISGVESNHQHVMARATLKAEVPIVNAGSTDPGLLEHAIPWIVRVMSDDRQNAYTLLEHIVKRRGLKRIAVLRINDRDGRVGIEELKQGARRLGHPVVIEQRFLSGDQDFSPQLDRIAAAGPDCIFLLGNPHELGLIVRAVRARDRDLPIFAYDRCVMPEFLATAGPAAEGVVAVATFRPDDGNPHWARFREAYRHRVGAEPNAFAAHSYDAMRLVVAAVRSAGLNRVRIRDALFAFESFEGATGTIEFDTTANNVRQPWLVEVRGGRFHYFRASEDGSAR